MAKAHYRKVKSQNLKFYVLSFGFAFCVLNFTFTCFAQQNDELEFNLDTAAATTPLPKIFKPCIDLSGRGFHRVASWPQTAAAKEAIDTWHQDIGFGGLYRLQYNLWEISQLSEEKEVQEQLLANYEAIIKNISDAGGTVILNLFGTPVNFGRVLDKKSPPRDLRAFKALVKNIIRDLSCNKRYNIWYEVWTAPDLDDFFLGREQEYLHLYRVVAESAKELRAETKIHIPVGAPSASWWFQNLAGNTIVSPERSLIYTLIKFCYRYHLPLDFVSWHSFSTDPASEKESTIYKKSAVTLIRDWLSYFDFDKNTPLVVDEWNFDIDANVLAARGERSFIGASFIPSRIRNMHMAGIDYQVYYCLEDFQRNREGVVRNVGLFSFDPEENEYKGIRKATYKVFRMLATLGQDMYPLKFGDEFAGSIATKTSDGYALLFYNYIDPQMVTNYLTKNIAGLKPKERKIVLNLISSEKLEKIMLHQLEGAKLRVSNRIKNFLKKAQALNDKAKKFEYNARSVKINIKNLLSPKAPERKSGSPENQKETQTTYLYQRYIMDASCSFNCEFAPVETKEIEPAALYQETLTLNPYSVHLILLKKKTREIIKEPEKEPAPPLSEVPSPAPAESVETTKEPSQETTQETPKEISQEPPKETPKEINKELPLESPEPDLKETPKEAPQEGINLEPSK
jgi:hypothetical protein